MLRCQKGFLSSCRAGSFHALALPRLLELGEKFYLLTGKGLKSSEAVGQDRAPPVPQFLEQLESIPEIDLRSDLKPK